MANGVARSQRLQMMIDLAWLVEMRRDAPRYLITLHSEERALYDELYMSEVQRGNRDFFGGYDARRDPTVPEIRDHVITIDQLDGPLVRPFLLSFRCHEFLAALISQPMTIQERTEIHGPTKAAEYAENEMLNLVENIVPELMRRSRKGED